MARIAIYSDNGTMVSEFRDNGGEYHAPIGNIEATDRVDLERLITEIRTAVASAREYDAYVREKTTRTD